MGFPPSQQAGYVPGAPAPVPQAARPEPPAPPASPLGLSFSAWGAAVTGHGCRLPATPPFSWQALCE